MLKILVAYWEISQGAQVILPVYLETAVFLEDAYLGAICHMIPKDAGWLA